MNDLIETVNKLPNINVVFDIDNCIATGFDNDDISKLEQEESYITNFKKNRLYIEANKPHIIHPGAIEFIQLLDRIPSIKISFFSSAIDNDSRVEQLLCLALGKERYNVIKNQTIICSRKDLEKSTDKMNSIQYKNFGLPPMNFKKNLQQVLTPNDDLAWTVLIDDDESNAYYDQEKNILKVPSICAEDFEYAHSCSKENIEWEWNIFSRFNHVSYSVGILFAALKIADQEKHKTLSDALFQIQFKQNTDKFAGSKMKLNTALYLDNNMHYYELGLEKLREMNPNLQFLNSKNYLTEFCYTSKVCDEITSSKKTEVCSSEVSNMEILGGSETNGSKASLSYYPFISTIGATSNNTSKDNNNEGQANNVCQITLG